MLILKLHLIVSQLLLSSAVIFGQGTPEVGQTSPTLILESTEGIAHNLALNQEGPRIVLFFRGSW